VVGARPGVGKTALGLSVALNAARKGYRVGFVSTEMSPSQLGQRLISLDSGIPAIAMRDASLSEMQYAALSATAMRIADLPIRIYDRPACKLSDINLQARAWRLTGGLDMLVVDYLQRLVPDEKSDSRTREVGKFASGLKTLARTLNLPVMALSQLNRGLANRADKRPNMADLRDSGEIEQEADSVWMLHRPAVYDDKADEYDAEIIIGKNRHGPCEIIRAGWEGGCMRWEGRRDYPGQQAWQEESHG
jgi:replicative DNA helicase